MSRNLARLESDVLHRAGAHLSEQRHKITARLVYINVFNILAVAVEGPGEPGAGKGYGRPFLVAKGSVSVQVSQEVNIRVLYIRTGPIVVYQAQLRISPDGYGAAGPELDRA